jgi:hypothetical protein
MAWADFDVGDHIGWVNTGRFHITACLPCDGTGEIPEQVA